MSNQKDCNNCCSLFLRNLPHGFCVNLHSSESGRLGRRNQRAECAGADSHGRADHVSERTSARVTPHSVGRCREATEGPGPEGLRPQAVGERTVRLPEIFRAMARFSPSAPSGHRSPSGASATSPVSGESVSQRGPRGEHTFFDSLKRARKRPLFCVSKASSAGKAAARRRLMRAELANASREWVIAAHSPLIRPRAGPRPPSPAGEGNLAYSSSSSSKISCATSPRLMRVSMARFSIRRWASVSV